MAEKKRGPGRPPGSKNKKTETTKSAGSKAKQKAQEIQAKKKADKRVVDEIWAIITIAIGVFLAVAVLTTGAGKFGMLIGQSLKGLFAFIAYILPFYLIIFGILLFAKKTSHFSLRTLILLLITLFMLCTMNSIRFVEPATVKWSMEILAGYYSSGEALLSGGYFGMIIASLLVVWLGGAGAWIFSLVTTLVCLLLLINTPLSRFIQKISDKMEERKLIRENAHLDDEPTEPAVEVKPWPEIKRDPSSFMKVGSRKPEVKVLNSSILEDDEQKMPEEKAEEKSSYIPVSTITREPLPSEAQNSVLNYMNDDSLFGRGETGTTGLEEKREAAKGYGIDGPGTVAAGIGLTPTKQDSPTIMPKEEKKDEPEIKAEQIAMAGVKDKDPQEKLSNKEAREAMLTSEEINSSHVNKYNMPSIELLEKNNQGGATNSRALQAKAEKLEETLRSFNVDARIIQVIQGPTVTRYEIQPAIGVKVSKIVSLADDIALNLEARSIRIEAPIPGKAAVGIEVENDSVTMVRLREIIDSENFKKSKSKITFAVGKDISGKAIVADLKAMPHMLIAGSTGSGKSVCINSIITSLLYKANPDEVKMILIDPKVVELGNYNGIPHLLIPVVTDPSKAAAALNWAVAEMTDRYKKFAEEGVRDLESYNDFVRAEGETEKVLPQVVIIIDELADLMMAAPSQIEESICRLAQMARAAGMHLIVATQRPSVDVITGVIKANIPSRIAFAVSSQVDSRTILDMAGAEKLVGKGDMLFNPMGMGKPIRVQGTFVSDHEVSGVIEYVKSQVEGEAQKYSDELISRIERTSVQEDQEETDDLLSDAIDMVVRSGQASVSMLQRRFRIGYNRAARIMDMMEARGVVGPQDGSRPRQVLMTEAELLTEEELPEILEEE